MDYTPLNRHEKYLNAIMNGDNDNLPKPENREEAYLYNIAMNSGGGGGATDAVKYTEQTLTSAQQAQARENIGAAASTDIPTDVVKYTAQTLTDAQKTQARTNIGAGTSNFSGNYSDLTNAPPLVKGSGTGGDMIGGTGVNQNSTRYTNSVAYGAFAAAVEDHAFAFGNRAFAGTNRGGKHAVAIGNNVRAEKDYEWAIGKFNQSNDDTVFSIGDGTSDSNRHNLMELKTGGIMLLNGNAVKTEGGDDDNKLRLGQICGITDAHSSTDTKSVYQGFKNLLASSNTTGIIFSSSDISGNVGRSGQIQICQFGDFIGCRKAESTVEIAPLAGRSAGKTKTGAWIHVESCYYMFYNCSGVTSLDLSMFDTSEVKDMTYMFYGCTALTSLDLSSFDMTNVLSRSYMFGNGVNTSPPLTILKTPKINPYSNISFYRTLYSRDGTAYTKLPVTTGTSIELRQSWT